MVKFERLQRICGDGEQRQKEKNDVVGVGVGTRPQCTERVVNPTLLYGIQNPGTNEENVPRRWEIRSLRLEY